MKLRPSTGTVCRNLMDEMIFGVECSIEVERLRSVVESYESGADRALVAYFLNVDFHQYCSKMGMFDIPKSKRGAFKKAHMDRRFFHYGYKRLYLGRNIHRYGQRG